MNAGNHRTRTRRACRRSIASSSSPIDPNRRSGSTAAPGRTRARRHGGAVRDGGSFEERMGKVACWNSVMDEDRYMVRRWNEFIAA